MSDQTALNEHECFMLMHLDDGRVKHCPRNATEIVKYKGESHWFCEPCARIVKVLKNRLTKY
jgi:hypothetical protein